MSRVEGAGSERHGLDDLLELMAVLRDEREGCPWDVEQRWETIAPHTLEEAYEVVDAIERGAFGELKLELGDLLFQVVYYAQFAREEGRFDFLDVVDGLVRKMIVRHPHVFPEGRLDSRRENLPARTLSQAQIGERWERRKASERDARAERSSASVLDDIPLALPALSRAAKLSRRASRLGFDWPDHTGALDKVDEELAEVREAIAASNHDAIEDELGDLLFATATLAGKLGVDPERALRRAGAKFERRFRGVEARCRPGDGLDTLERHWQAVKSEE
ncbi:nucleoside triphosphate pyrophosphohydrolase [Halotalea alkalilenta]|uniref:Nucleoside triphosphate pyrophosphohydrolase n=1 Tax=Halotalea alkalilenta TaxID=376489 RepID=A0A172YFK9_9GAMM|nr:nucleoside triphosphate pyrophosphohydrolase [Halotalea alkalilenta]ANF57987.1 nucleoside triphosphate pyrophosphohydrolase [Halotalea alkalilenta]